MWKVEVKDVRSVSTPIRETQRVNVQFLDGKLKKLVLFIGDGRHEVTDGSDVTRMILLPTVPTTVLIYTTE